MLITVHGTWAQKAPWAQADSRLAKAVVHWFSERGAGATVVPFDWSGRNSIAERRIAGANLADRLEQLRREDPDASIYVIAHSHGGSVFAYAMKIRPETVDKIDGFIALATPWVGIEPCSYATAMRQLLTKLALLAAFVGVLWALPAVLDLL